MQFSNLLESAQYLGLHQWAQEELCSFWQLFQASTQGNGPDLYQASLTILQSSLSVEEKIPKVMEKMVCLNFSGREERLMLLALALGQVPSAREHRESQQLWAPSAKRTLSDITLWANHFRKQTGSYGLTSRILGWAQSYLTGNLTRIGEMHFALIGLKAPYRFFRHRYSGEFKALTVNAEGGRSREVDLHEGIVLENELTLGEDFELILAPGMPVLDMHLPADAKLGPTTVIENIAQAFAFFSQLLPQLRPIGVCGEGWYLDPQMADIFSGPGIAPIQKNSKRYPSGLLEIDLIRRFFGPDADRESVVKMDPKSNVLVKKRLIEFFQNPNNQLRPKGSFISAEECQTLYLSLQAQGL